MTLNDLLDVTGITVNVKFGDSHAECVSRDNLLLARYVFDMKVKCISADHDEYGNHTLEVEIEE